ncbi:tetraacyldisaccharide 4'-kinase [uncultured Desulfuromonas sp.]|uniref:tetraacyldisaccharide 4'-kinase n=1 Tax=uncultured Desulfuromonas sp. TaxID=181013 RepID=UPI002AAB68F8|nr:tetraacyldisaccharide 4'-kinase [uncultured Desulfuromonas sp.]
MAFFVSLHHRLVTQGAQTWPDKLLFVVLLPVSLLYGAMNWLRGSCYDRGWLSTYRSSLPIISVGNLAVGGLGKTPVVDWLVNYFCRQGKRVAIVSRGYGGSFTGDVGVVSSGDGQLLMAARVAGDEPVLLARHNPHVPVLIARKRMIAIQELERSFDVDLVVLDDAFQHRQVGRSIDLVLLDATRPFGNGWPLPLGNLREFPCALQRADLLLLTRGQGAIHEKIAEKPTFSSRHVLAKHVTDLEGSEILVDPLRGKTIVAFAGIANPDAFFRSLSELGLSLSQQIPLADHVEYTPAVVRKLTEAAIGADVLITTEKDAVKLTANMFEIPCYQIPLTIEIGDYEAFGRHLQTLI